MKETIFKNPVFYHRPTLTIIDTAHLDESGAWRGWYSKQNLSEIQARYPNAKICEENDAVWHMENQLKTDPEEITEEKFLYFLGVLPPEDWRRDETGESFKLSEYTSGNITTICACKGGKYYSFQGDHRLTHGAIMGMIEETDGRERP